MNDHPTQPDRIERVLRFSRRGLITALVILLIAAATLIAHAIRPGSLLSDWPSKAPWLIPVAIAAIFATTMLLTRDRNASREDAKIILKTLADDEFRQANLARAQRVALAIVIVAQVPLAALALSQLSTAAAVTVMAVTTATLGIGTLIISFLVFDRE